MADAIHTTGRVYSQMAYVACVTKYSLLREKVSPGWTSKSSPARHNGLPCSRNRFAPSYKSPVVDMQGKASANMFNCVM